MNTFIFRGDYQNADRFFENAEDMTAWIDQPSIVPFLKYISDDTVKRTFRDLVVDKMIKETLQEDGTCFETFRRVNLFARKLCIANHCIT